MRLFVFVVLLCLAACARDPKPSALELANTAMGELRAAVMREVKDPARAAQGTALVDEIERLLAEVDTDLKAHNARIRTLNADYDATPEAFRAAFRDFNARRNERQRRVVDINQRAKALLTAAEWKALGRVREEALEKTLAAGREG
jgi:hypothetical protein